MKSAYRVLAGLICLGVLVQAAAIAMGWFLTIGEIDGGLVIDKAYIEDEGGNVGHAIHAIVGFNLMPLLGLLFFVVSFFTKTPGAVKWAGLTFLAIIVQVALAIIAFSAGGVGALHGLNAFVVFGLGLMALRRMTARTLPDRVGTRAETTTV